MTQNNSNNTYQFFTAYKYGADASKYTSCNHFIRCLALARNDCCFLLALYCYTNLFSSRFHNSYNLGNICLNLTKTCVHVLMPCSYSIHFLSLLKWTSLHLEHSQVFSSMQSLLAVALPTCRCIYMLLQRLLPPRTHEKAEKHGCYSYIKNSHERNAGKASIV